VKFINLGQNSLTYMAMKSGIIDATTLQVPQTFFAQDEGYRKLAATADFYRVVQGGLTTTKLTLSERPELALKVIRVTLKAVRLIVNDKKYTIKIHSGSHEGSLSGTWQRARPLSRSHLCCHGEGLPVVRCGGRKASARDDRAGERTDQTQATSYCGAGF
jgi:hypothetical protein